MPFRRKNCDDVLSRHGFTPAMSFYEKYPDCVSDTKKHPTAKAVGCFFGGPCVLWRENPLRRSGAKRADCHDCTAPVREPTDTRRNECAVGTLKKFANLSPHISVQIPLWSTSRQCLHPLPDRKKAEPSRVPRWEGSDCFLWILFEKTWFYPVFSFCHFGSVTKKSQNADIFRILVGRELMSSDF